MTPTSPMFAARTYYLHPDLIAGRAEAVATLVAAGIPAEAHRQAAQLIQVAATPDAINAALNRPRAVIAEEHMCLEWIGLSGQKKLKSRYVAVRL